MLLVLEVIYRVYPNFANPPHSDLHPLDHIEIISLRDRLANPRENINKYLKDLRDIINFHDPPPPADLEQLVKVTTLPLNILL